MALSQWLARTDLILPWALLAGSFVLSGAYLYRVSTYGRARYERIDRQGGSRLLGQRVMEMAYWGMQPIARWMVSAGITANMLSWSTVFFGAVAAICLGLGYFGAGGWLALLAAVLDALDGMVARLTDTTSLAGKVLDTTLDRYVEFLFIGSMIFWFHGSLWLQGLATLALLGSYMVSYSSAQAEILKIAVPRGSMQRAERMVYLIAGAVLTPIWASFAHQNVAMLREWERASGLPAYPQLPMILALGLIALVGNVSAARRFAFVLRELKFRERRSHLRERPAAVQKTS